MRRKFSLCSTIADVSSPIIRAHFLKHHDLLVDVKRSKLIDNAMQLHLYGITTVSETSISVYDSDGPFANLMKEYKDITMLKDAIRPTSTKQT